MIGNLLSGFSRVFAAPIIKRFTKKSDVGSGRLNNLWKNAMADKVESTVAGASPESIRLAVNIQIKGIEAGNQVLVDAIERERAKLCKRNMALA